MTKAQDAERQAQAAEKYPPSKKKIKGYYIFL